MFRGIGYLTGMTLILVGIGDAISRGWLVDGWFLILGCGGFTIVALTYLTGTKHDPRHGGRTMIPIPGYSYYQFARDRDRGVRVARQTELHAAAVARRRKAKRGGKR